MDDNFLKMPLDSCLYVVFNGTQYSVLRGEVKEYRIGEMLCEMGNVIPAEIKPVLLSCAGLDKKPTLKRLDNVFVELNKLLIERFGLVAGSIICNEMLCMSADLIKGKRAFIENIKDEGATGKFVFEDTGYEGPGTCDIRQFLLTAYCAVILSQVAFKFLYKNIMETLTGGVEKENELKILSLYGELMAAQHIDYKIMLLEGSLSNVYGIQNAISLLAFEFANAFNNNVNFAKCRNCGRYFVLTGRIDSVYCSYPAPSYGKRTCKEIGAQVTRRNKEKSEASTGEYRKIYMRLKMKSRRHPKDNSLWEKLEELVKGGKEWRTKLNNGEATTEDFLKWLDNYK